MARFHHSVLIVASLLLSALALSACDGDDGGAGPVVAVPQDDSTYVEGVAGTWQRLNPIYAGSNAVDDDLTRLIFSGLTTIGSDGTVEPDLAESWTVEEEGRVYRFTLREDLRWHDGEPVTASDVAFTVSQIVDPDYAGDPVLAQLWAPVSVATPDQRTVVVTLTQPFAPFLARATTVGILPRHLLGTVSAQQMHQSPFNSAPVGTGPYRLQSLDSQRAVLTAYEGYHFGAPAIGRVEVAFAPDYPTAAGGLGSAIDGLYLRDTASERATLEGLGGDELAIEVAQSSAYLVLYLNNSRVPFEDPSVRLALSLAVDRTAIVETAMGGHALASSSPIAPGSWAYKPESDVVAQNQEAARALLLEAGFTQAPGTGVMTRDGTEFRFTIRTDADPVRVAIANMIADQLEEIGIRVQVVSTSFAQLRRDFLQLRQYDAALAVWEQGPDPDPYFGWHSSQTGPEGLNLANFADFVVDTLISRARVTTSDETRLDLYLQIQDKWRELTPSLVIAYPVNAYISTRDIEREELGVLFRPAQRFRHIERWQR